jgi:hypothetical protein
MAIRQAADALPAHTYAYDDDGVDNALVPVDDDVDIEVYDE